VRQPSADSQKLAILAGSAVSMRKHWMRISHELMLAQARLQVPAVYTRRAELADTRLAAHARAAIAAHAESAIGAAAGPVARREMLTLRDRC
jgi:hypothetical protein